MIPIRHNDNSLALSKTTGSKDASPPDSKGIPPNSSLSKALDAIVAAGKRGLLGPAAMVAAESVPKLNLGGSNGAASQEDSNPIPLVTGSYPYDKRQVTGRYPYDKRQVTGRYPYDKRKKIVNEKRTPVITVVSSAEGVGNLQPTPKEIWICGNSVILASKERARSHPYGLQLGISTSRADVYWHGIQTMMWKQLIPLVHEIYHLRSPPSVIIIHLGEDDLLPRNNTSLIISMKNDLGILKRAFPDTIIVWSSLLPRRIWKKNQKPERMKRVRKHVNKIMVAYCNEIGVHFLSHNLITADKSDIFLPDVNDLSDKGADIFIADLKKVLRLYQILE